MGTTINDLINRADALEQIAQAECGLHYEDCEADNCTCDYIWRILNIPSAESKTKEWIPVSEELPKKNGEYLVTISIPIQDYNNVFYEELDIMFLTFKNGKFFDEFETTDYHNFVTAWMLKPKPYRKDDEA